MGAKRGLVLRSLARARSFVSLHRLLAGCSSLALLSALLSLDNTNLRPRPSPRPLARSDARLRRWELRGEEGVKALSPSLRH